MRTRWFFLILGVAFLLRMVAAVYWQQKYCQVNPFFFGDSLTYWDLGRSVAESVRSGVCSDAGRYEWGTYHWQIFRTPGYPTILAPLFLLFGDSPPIMAARVLGAVLGTLTVAAVAWLSRILFQPFFNDENKANTAALLSSAIVAVEPCQILTSILVLSEAPFCLFMVLQIAFWVRGLHSNAFQGTFRDYALSGLCYAVAVYCRPSWLYFVPFVIGVIGVLGVGDWIMGRRPRSLTLPALKPLITILVVFVLAMLPWWIRNYHVSGHFVATSLQMGPSLYDGLSPTADGSSQMDFVPHFLEEERLEEERLKREGDPFGYLRDTYEYRTDQRMKKAAIAWAKENPGRVWELAWIKVVRLWNVWPNEPSFSSLPVRIVIFFTYVPIMVFAITGIIFTWKSGFSFWILWIPSIYFTSLHVIFVSSLRYRIPPMLLLIVLAGGAFVCFANLRR